MECGTSYFIHFVGTPFDPSPQSRGRGRRFVEEWKAALAANIRERWNGRCVVDCGGKGRVATDITSYSRQLYRLENQHDAHAVVAVIQVWDRSPIALWGSRSDGFQMYPKRRPITWLTPI